MTKFIFGVAIFLWMVFFYYKQKLHNADRVNSILRIANVQSLEHLRVAVNVAKKANQIASVATFVTVFGILLLIL